MKTIHTLMGLMSSYNDILCIGIVPLNLNLKNLITIKNVVNDHKLFFESIRLTFLFLKNSPLFHVGLLKINQIWLFQKFKCVHIENVPNVCSDLCIYV